jgi:hypothetical protein
MQELSYDTKPAITPLGVEGAAAAWSRRAVEPALFGLFGPSRCDVQRTFADSIRLKPRVTR